MDKSQSEDLLVGDLVFIFNPKTQTFFQIQAKLPGAEKPTNFIFFKVINRTEKSIIVRVAPRGNSRSNKRTYKSALVDRYRFVFRDGKWRNGQGYLKSVTKLQTLTKFLGLFETNFRGFLESIEQLKASEEYHPSVRKRNFQELCQGFRNNLLFLTSPVFVRRRTIIEALQAQWDLDWLIEPKIAHFFLAMICERYSLSDNLQEIDVQGLSGNPIWPDLISNISRLQSSNFTRLLERYPDIIQNLSSKLYEFFTNYNHEFSENQQNNLQILVRIYPPTYPVIPHRLIKNKNKEQVYQYWFPMSTLPIFNSPDFYCNLDVKVWSDLVIYLPLFIFRQYYVNSNRRKKAMSLTVRLENLQFLMEQGVQPRICPKALVSAGMVDTFKFYEKIGVTVPLDVLLQFLYLNPKDDESRIKPILLFLKPRLNNFELPLPNLEINENMLELLMNCEFDQLIQLILESQFNSHYPNISQAQIILKRGYRLLPKTLQKAYNDHLWIIENFPVGWITPLPDQIDWLRLIRKQRHSRNLQQLLQQFVEKGWYPDAQTLKQQIFNLGHDNIYDIPVEELQTDPFFRFTEDETQRLITRFGGESLILATLLAPFPDYWNFISGIVTSRSKLQLVKLGIRLNIPIRECDLQQLHRIWRRDDLAFVPKETKEEHWKLAQSLNNLSSSSKLVDFTLCHSDNDCEPEYEKRKHRRFLINYLMLGLECDSPIVEAVHLHLLNS